MLTPSDACGNWTLRQQPTRQAGEVQSLGEMPWASRATALRPDPRQVRRTRSWVKSPPHTRWERVSQPSQARYGAARVDCAARIEVLPSGGLLDVVCDYGHPLYNTMSNTTISESG